ncbi:GntR family transcriptional regulator [Sulfitobacter noctilucicola]|uniref:DNA-binding GntR family transcriptional regulator n=1 Tax=Sulfitobacter noctilucicola TaxID=1342301 RepID=A0A7W6M5I7_9RHOB|nr:GntR family transcriptional regulator [Sulfitobacter noctilucicola]MBB4172473.1 DNA-binding GntR family transcriptional regulator [Sulfitobacter noctilucicola]
MNLDVIAPANPFLAEDAGKMPAHQVVYEQVRAMILFGDLAPGQAVTIQGLTTQLSAGMTPVREALRRLIAEGALTHQGNRRVSVPILTPDCANELGFMRKTLEPELTRRAVMNIDASRLAAITACDTELNRAIAHGDIGGYLTQNYRFHAMIYEAANAPIMAATVDRLWLRFGPSLRVVCGRFGTSNLPDKHKDLLEAIGRRDPEDAARAMLEDVMQGASQIETVLQDT